MNVTVTNARTHGAIEAPTSKSAAHRLLMAASLSEELSVLCVNGMNRDIEATIACMSALGAKIERTAKTVSVRPIDRERLKEKIGAGETIELPVSESGTTLRILLPVLGALSVRARIVMEGRLPERPLAPLDLELTRHGMTIKKRGNELFVSGRLEGGAYTIPGDVSSQYISGLLFALPLLSEDSTLEIVNAIESKNYIEMTERALHASSVTFEKEGRIYRIPGGQKYRLHGRMIVEGDYSGGAAILAAAAVSGESVTVTGLMPDTAQGDREILAILRRFGAEVTEKDDAVTVRRRSLSGVTVDASQIPDLVPVIAAVGALSDGTTTIKNASRLRLKESDRLQTTREALSSIGAEITETEDGLVICGKRTIAGGSAQSHHDHRIAMALAVASFGAESPVTIGDAESVEKSYPAFFEALKKLGGKVDYEYDLR